MADTVSAEVRSRIMAAVRGKNTKPEMVLRRGLHAKGFRFRLHQKDLPGKPDIVLPRYRAVVLANGCFWHGHDCHLFKLPSTRTDFWFEKISRNRYNDDRNREALAQMGWREAVVWECALKSRTRLPLADIIETLTTWIKDGGKHCEIAGRRN